MTSVAGPLYRLDDSQRRPRAAFREWTGQDIDGLSRNLISTLTIKPSHSNADDFASLYRTLLKDIGLFGQIPVAVVFFFAVLKLSPAPPGKET